MPGSFLGERDELGERRGRDLGLADHDGRQADQRGDRREVLDRVVTEARVERRVDRQRAGIAEHQHMAVWRRLGDHVGGDDAAGARHVLDDERLAERWR